MGYEEYGKPHVIPEKDDTESSYPFPTLLTPPDPLSDLTDTPGEYKTGEDQWKVESKRQGKERAYCVFPGLPFSGTFQASTFQKLSLDGKPHDFPKLSVFVRFGKADPRAMRPNPWHWRTWSVEDGCNK